MRFRGTISSEGLGKKIRCDVNNLDPVHYEDFWDVVLTSKEQFDEKMKERCGGDLSRATRYRNEIVKFLKTRKDLTTREEIIHVLSGRAFIKDSDTP